MAMAPLNELEPLLPRGSRLDDSGLILRCRSGADCARRQALNQTSTYDSQSKSTGSRFVITGLLFAGLLNNCRARKHAPRGLRRQRPVDKAEHEISLDRSLSTAEASLEEAVHAIQTQLEELYGRLGDADARAAAAEERAAQAEAEVSDLRSQLRGEVLAAAVASRKAEMAAQARREEDERRHKKQSELAEEKKRSLEVTASLLSNVLAYRKQRQVPQMLAGDDIHVDVHVDVDAEPHKAHKSARAATSQASRKQAGAVDIPRPSSSKAAKSSQSSMFTAEDLEGMSQEEVSETLELCRETLLEDCQYTAEQVELDQDVQLLRKKLDDFHASPQELLSGQAQFRHQRTKKESLKHWYHQKYQRRHGLLPAHFLNTMRGRDTREKSRLLKDFVKAKRKARDSLRVASRNTESLDDSTAET
eukprot:TRINITY_DN20027_c0_g2_i1.p1 TRINITY_DN20027_c0_g2~~TRINITY_DN20027_c0_g2_i1.p1  ORF type:complete len:419 (+),score=81.08 TRINITY_DN20027_c0_g2_i1:376-1632(+)